MRDFSPTLWQKHLLNFLSTERDDVASVADGILATGYDGINAFLLAQCKIKKVGLSQIMIKEPEVLIVSLLICQQLDRPFELLTLLYLGDWYRAGWTLMDFIPPSPPPSASATNEPPRDGVGG